MSINIVKAPLKTVSAQLRIWNVESDSCSAHEPMIVNEFEVNIHESKAQEGKSFCKMTQEIIKPKPCTPSDTGLILNLRTIDFTWYLLL